MYFLTGQNPFSDIGSWELKTTIKPKWNGLKVDMGREDKHILLAKGRDSKC